MGPLRSRCRCECLRRSRRVGAQGLTDVMREKNSIARILTWRVENRRSLNFRPNNSQPLLLPSAQRSETPLHSAEFEMLRTVSRSRRHEAAPSLLHLPPEYAAEIVNSWKKIN